MGSWNETCGLSGLPIEENTKALLFPLTSGMGEGSNHSGFSYPTGLWQPMMLPFYGIYSSYGTLDNPSCASLELNIRMFQSYGIEWSDTTLYDLERGTLSGRLGRLGQTGPIGQMLIRQDIWDAFLDLQPEHRAQCRLGTELWVQYERSHEDTDTIMGQFGMEEYFRGFYPQHGSFFFALFGTSLPDFKWFALNVRDDIRKNLVSSDTLQAVAYEFADVVHVNRVMALVRRAWGPQTGKGSQNAEWDLHRDLANKISEISARIIAENEAENGD